MESRRKDYFKHLNSSTRTVKIAAYISIPIFNEEHADILKIMDVLEIKMGPQCKQYADTDDAEQIRHQERACLTGNKEARAARKMNQIQEQEFFE